ncbi:MAG: metallophosphoesterase family protein [Acutalibacteraceae bacterium]
MQLPSEIKNLIASVKGMLAAILSFALAFGLITAQSTSEPIKFKDSDSVQLSFVAIADTHTRDDAFQGYYLSRFFDDLENTDENFDAVIIAGDLTDNGFNSEYDVLFKYLDNQTAAENVLITLGNHDARYEYKENSKIIMDEVKKLTGVDTQGKSYYSYDINGYTFIMLSTEKAVFERAYISDAQLKFLDSELARATKDGKPAFVVCHQPLKNTHGLPDVWKTGDIGDQSEQVKEILTKYENVFYFNGHLHDGVYERSIEKLSDSVYTINLPAYGKDNDYGDYHDTGLGCYFEVYSDEIVLTARNFKTGTPTDYTYTFDLAA